MSRAASRHSKTHSRATEQDAHTGGTYVIFLLYDFGRRGQRQECLQLVRLLRGASALNRLPEDVGRTHDRSRLDLTRGGQRQ